MMKEHPILFSGPMVRAILEGRKTQTRRLVNRLRGFGPVTEFRLSDSFNYEWTFRDCEMRCFLTSEKLKRALPYQPGDRLWVREAWKTLAEYDHLSPSEIPPNAAIQYLADDPLSPWDSRTRASIHMPRFASRITLEVEDIRVEWLQWISEEDAEAEGASPILVPPDGGSCPHVEGFEQLWDSINGSRPGASWADNPWVMAIMFKQVQPLPNPPKEN